MGDLAWVKDPAARMRMEVLRCYNAHVTDLPALPSHGRGLHQEGCERELSARREGLYPSDAGLRRRSSPHGFLGSFFGSIPKSPGGWANIVRYLVENTDVEMDAVDSGGLFAVR